METGEPKFSTAYRDKYGPLTSDSTLETAAGKSFAMATSEKGPFLHVADDSSGTHQREVIQEFTKKEAGQVGTAIYSGVFPWFKSQRVLTHQLVVP